MASKRTKTRLQTKQIYKEADPADGQRILIDRLWPRGLSKKKAQVDCWAKDAAPSNELRKWYRHDPEKWEAFRTKYFAELDASPEAVKALRAVLKPGLNTILFASREENLNNAWALVEYLEDRRG